MSISLGVHEAQIKPRNVQKIQEPRRGWLKEGNSSYIDHIYKGVSNGIFNALTRATSFIPLSAASRFFIGDSFPHFYTFYI